LIKLRDFSFTYNGANKPALKNIDVDIIDGEFILITGPSGGGKSTLCRCFNGLVPHFYGGTVSGAVNVQGMDVFNNSPRELAEKVGMVFQDPENQMVTTGVEREIAFGLENLGLPINLISRRIEEALDTVGISSLRFRNHSELSGGQKQKVAIASVLALHPEILVLDEPTSELDPQSAEEVLSLLERLNDELGITIILVEHRLDRLMHLVDRILVVSNGEITVNSTPRKLIDNENYINDGLGLPPIVRLIDKLRHRGLELDSLPITVKEARVALQKTTFHTLPVVFSSNGKTGDNLLMMEHVWFAYENRVAVRDISLSINSGEFIAVIGRNASGKTTFAKLLNGLLKPDKGKVKVKGIDTRNSTVADLSRSIGYVFQNPNDHLFADTVEAEILLSLLNSDIEKQEIDEAINRILYQFNLVEYKNTYPRYLSGGEKQRVALASVLVTRPEIVILDEPTRGMDYQLKQELVSILNNLRLQGTSIIMITHDIEMVAECADRVILLSEGEIVVDDNKRDVLSRALIFSPQINRLAQSLNHLGIAGNTLTVEEFMEQVS
jgi:energy-coupling factor transporter ATP-binding protein EcfA2